LIPNEIFSMKYFKNELKSSSSLPKFENRFSEIYSILTNISQRINLTKNATANYCEDDVAEVAEAVYWAESRQAENQSDHSQVWVENGFNHNVKFDHVFMIQVHKRPSYFKPMIDSLSKVWNISEVLLVISHSAYDEEMNNIVKSIKFCPVLQLFYPLRMELFQEKFPNADPEHCNGTCCRPESKRRSIKVAQIAQIKHHWWWKVRNYPTAALVQAFEYIEELKNSNFWITLLEEDHYASPDLYETLKSVIKDKLKFCEECQIIVPGNYFQLPVNKNQPPNEIKIEYWYSSTHNLGMTFSRTFWNELKLHAVPFCTYNDYNWDWTLNHIQTHIARNWKAVVFKSSRLFHIGDWYFGTHTKLDNCNASLEAVKNYIKEINIRTYTFKVDEGGRLFANWVTPQPFGAWSIITCTYFTLRHMSLKIILSVCVVNFSTFSAVFNMINMVSNVCVLAKSDKQRRIIYLVGTVMFCRSQNRGYSRGFSQATRAISDEDEEDSAECNGGVAFARQEGLSIGAASGEIGDSFSKIGTPCSCLVASIVPSKRLLRSGDDDVDPASNRYLCLDDYDQFGFKIGKKENGEENGRTVDGNQTSLLVEEECKLRLRWIAYLEFTFNSRVVEDLTWEKVESFLPRSEELASLVRAGVPHSLRPYVWPRLCGATRRRQRADYTYADMLNELKKVDDQDDDDDYSLTFGQIEKDLMRTLPNNVCFASPDGVGVGRLRRILRSIALAFPDVGYCQGMGVIAATLLLFLDEENAFWMMCTILDDLLPDRYFSDSLLGSAVDQRIFRLLIADLLPDVDAVFRAHDIEPSLVTLHWFLTLYASSAMPFPLLLRVWDLFFYYGSTVLFKVALAMLKLRQDQFRTLANSADVFNLLSSTPSSLGPTDVEPLLRAIDQLDTDDRRLPSLRATQRAYLQLARRRPTNHSAVGRRLFRRRHGRCRARSTSSSDFDQSSSAKNIRQTELLVELKQTIAELVLEMASRSPTVPASLQADYSVESHSRDYDLYTEAHRLTRRWARALVDFERHEDDELGFCKNDLVEVLSRRDEHCWIGELNGRRGWFPAKFVQLVDDQLRDYSTFPSVVETEDDDDDDNNDDNDFTEKITKLVRHQFCTILKTIFEYGMKKSSLLGRPFHPWLFIESVANEEIRKEHLSVHSRLMLSQTFQLDQDGQTFTPEELLYKALQYVNLTHDLARVSSMDVKFRSLICLGLNEQALHLWFELLCTSNGDLVDQWYQPWSFIRSPAWVQLKCELRLLAQFVFKLNSAWELPTTRKRPGNNHRPIQESVRDMLLKHHLFNINKVKLMFFNNSTLTLCSAIYYSCLCTVMIAIFSSTPNVPRCPFRHSKSALGTEIVCQAWLQGRCRKAGCGYRHMKNGKTRSTMPCYWENQPGGCLKQHCVFMHLKPRDKSLSAADYSPPPQKAKASKPCKKRTYDDGRVWINPKLSVSVNVEDDDENANPLRGENNNMKKKAKTNDTCIEADSQHGELELDDLIVNDMVDDNDVKCGVSFQSNAKTKFGKESDSNSERQSLDDYFREEEEKQNEEFPSDPEADNRQPNGSENCLHRQQERVEELNNNNNNNKSCISEKKNEENMKISTDIDNDNKGQKTNSKLGRAEYEARLLEVLGEDLAKTLAEEGIEFDLNDP
ncbi:Small G protein signaling modulator 3, partial [Trichinella sp. T8]